jgi:alkaline phosphatase
MVKKAYNKKVGVVTTARLTHATPACVYSKSADRNWEASACEHSRYQRSPLIFTRHNQQPFLVYFLDVD